MVIENLTADYQNGKKSTLEVLSDLEGLIRIPLSEGQKGLWALYKMHPQFSNYNVPLCLKIANLNINHMATALSSLLQQYPILNSHITAGELQLTRSASEIKLNIIDVSEIDDIEIINILKKEAAKPFRLEQESLFRVGVYTAKNDVSYFLIVAHHILLDGGSTIVLLDTLITYYELASTGKEISVDYKIPNYAEYVEWERAELSGDQGKKDHDYWKKRLARLSVIENMPAQKFVRSDECTKGEFIRFNLPSERLQPVANFCKATNVSPGAFYLAIFKCLLYRYTDCLDLIVGVPFARKPNERFDKVIGHFINMLPIRTSINGNMPFSDLVTTIKNNLFGAIDHGALPFSHQVRLLEGKDQGAESPVFSISYNYQSMAANGGLQSLRQRAKSFLPFDFVEELYQVGEYDLVLDIIPDGNPQFIIKFNPQVYNHSTIKRMSEHFSTLVKSAIANPAAHINSLDLLPANERRLLFNKWNNTAENYPKNKTCYQLFTKQVKKTPNIDALICNDLRITYADADKKIINLSQYINSLGGKSGDRIGIYVNRSIDMVVALLAVMRIGGTYVPLDPNYPKERVSYMVEDSGCHIILTQDELLDQANKNFPDKVKNIVIEKGVAFTSEFCTQYEPLDTATLAAYIIYTSGSTGKPKGVVVSHQALTNYILSAKKLVGFEQGDQLLAVTTYCFDIAGMELYMPLIAGGTCIIADNSTIKDADKLKDTLAKIKPDYFPGTPATFNMLFKVGWKNEENVNFLCGGDKISSHLKGLFDFYNCTVWNFYGPTETTIYSTVKKLEKGKSITIGSPIANTKIYVLDTNQQAVPIGIQGELYIGGDGVALGYWKKEELTAQKFLANPFKPGERMYRTGDLVKWLENGELELIGRMDNQIKIRGYRVELGEIETRLNQHADIESCVVICSDNNESSFIKAFYIPRKQSVNTALLRRYLSDLLPSHMIPEEFIAISEYPITPNGKIDRISLAMQDTSLLTAERHDNLVNPINVSSIREIFAGVLGHSNFSETDTFFNIGGDSFKAIDVVEKINQLFSCSEKVTCVFQYPTVAGLSEYLQHQHSDKTSAKAEASGPFEVNVDRQHSMPKEKRVFPIPDNYQNSYAIVGISCRFPGANDHHEFWRNLCSGMGNVEYWTNDELRKLGVAEELISNPDFVAQRTAISDKDKFDPEFFNISHRDAELMDPQARLLLQHSWKVIEDAGYRVDDIKNTSVYISASNNFYQALFPNFIKNMTESRVLDDADEYVAWLLAQGGSIPTLISNKLNLQGPSLFVSSNCSSSLSALYLACQGLATGDSDFALVGACTLFPANSIGYLYQPGLNFSSDGRCKAFDESADGMVGSEGVATVLIRRAPDAVRDGDNIYSIIRGIAVNNDGSDKVGFYAPGVNGQSAVVSRALQKSGVSAESIRFIEAHGTGTKIGDPIEVAALVNAYSGHTEKKQYCAIGSVKSNIGHLDTAAGLAGLIKTAMSLKHSELPPTIHFKESNKNIDFKNSPFYVAAAHERLVGSSSEPVRAGLSSFGIGGTNAHAILEKFYPEPNSSQDLPQSQLVLLSALDQESLQEAAKNLLSFIKLPNDHSLADLAYTLQVGRKVMGFRLAVVVNSFDALSRALSRYISEENLNGVGFVGRVENISDYAINLFLNPTEIQDRLCQWVNEGDLVKVAQAWVAGIAFDWSSLPVGTTRRRVSLPTYTFRKKRYWIDFVENNQIKIFNPPGNVNLKQDQALTSVDTEITLERLKDILIDRLADLLKMEAGDIDPEVAFSYYGFNSLSAVKLVNQLNKELTINIDVTRLYDYPSVATFHTFLVNEFGEQLASLREGSSVSLAADLTQQQGSIKNDRLMNAANEKQKQTEQTSTSFLPPIPMSIHKEPIAIIGMSGRFPESENIEEFWQHLAAGDDLVSQVSRWDLSKYAGRCNSGGFLNNIDCFDPLFFNISGVEALHMEPQQRIFLEESWRALEDAGYAGDAIKQLTCGVYVGCASGDYLNLNSDEPYAAQGLWGNMSSVIPARVSYFLNLKGPAIAIDTACSSSLVAISIACQALWSGDVDIALTGGVFLQCSPRLYIAGSHAGMLSPTGHCYSFDDRADGFVPAEGAVALVLKKLSSALADGDNIQGVIRGVGVNQDGASNGISAPSANSQQNLLQETYREFGINCADIQLVEAHGTGTKLGDPIEYQALAAAFSQNTDETPYCALGSSKSNIGHAQMAAGVIGMVKVLMAIKHKKIPPTIHYNRTNSNISLARSPFYINTRLLDWQIDSGKQRCGVVSSFGVSGTNGHIVLEEAPVRNRALSNIDPQCLLISARTNDQLREVIIRLRDYLQSNSNLNIIDIAYTLWKGRKHFSKRAAFTAESCDAAVAQLNNWLTGSTNNYQQISSDLSTLCKAYIKGDSVDASKFFSSQHPIMVSLPTYPFARDRYWFEDFSPLLYTNCSTHPLTELPKTARIEPVIVDSASPNENLFSLTLTGQEFFLKDHFVQKKYILPGSVFLEIARAAFGKLENHADKVIAFSNIVLLSPLSIENKSLIAYIKIIRGIRSEFEIFTKAADKITSHCKGEISLSGAISDANKDTVNLVSLLQQYPKKTISSATFYQEFQSLGVDYGPAFRGIQEAYGEPGAALVRICLPDVVADTLKDFSIHPIMVDCAVQSMKCLATEEEKGQAQLLFSIGEVELLRPCEQYMWVWIRYCKKSNGEFNTSKLDAELINEQGDVCMLFRGISTRKVPINSVAKPAPEYPSKAMLPIYNTALNLTTAPWPSLHENVVFIGADDNSRHCIYKHYPAAIFINIASQEDVNEIRESLLNAGNIDHLFWISPPERQSLNTNTLIDNQSLGVYQVFRIVKALLDLGYSNRNFGWTFILQHCTPLDSFDIADPTHSGVIGVIGALAKENANWRIRSVDIDVLDEKTISQLFTVTSDRLGNTYLLRDNEWYAQQLIPYENAQLLNNQHKGFSKQGVYAIVGGAGGLGSAISEHLITQYDAKVVWLGRRPIDESIQNKIDQQANLGRAPIYIQVDATDESSMRKAHLQVVENIGPVNGVIHAAMVLDPAMMNKMTEAQFANAYKAKADVSARLVETFSSDKLELILFLSTINSYMKTMGQSNYGAACTFKDAFAVRLSHELACRVKVINLGYCFNNIEDKDGNFDSVEMADFITREEFLAAIEEFVSSDLIQMIFMKPTPKWSTLGMVFGEEQILLGKEIAPSLIEALSVTAEDFDFNKHSSRVKDAVDAQNELLITI